MDDGHRHDADDAAKGAILLLPGLCSPPEVMRPLKRRLERRLRRPAHVLSLGVACGDIRDLAERTHAALEEMQTSRPETRVDVVGHSMGGIVAAYLLKCLDRGSRIRRVVTLGTPHRGLPIGHVGYVLPGPVGRSLRQLRPGSSLLDLLARLTVPPDCELVSIAGLGDAIVAPSATRLPELTGQRNLEVAADHLGLVLSKRAADSLVDDVLVSDAASPPASESDETDATVLRVGAFGAGSRRVRPTHVRASSRHPSIAHAIRSRQPA